MFTNAKTVIIGNKEVQSIVTSNGGVLYEKSGNYALSLASDKNSLNNGETVILTATLTYDSIGVPNKEVIFYNQAKPPINNSGSGASTQNKTLGSSFKLKYVPYGQGTSIYLISNDIELYYLANGEVRIAFNGSTRWITLWNCKDYLKLENGILSDSNGNNYDISSYDNNLILKYIYSQGIVYPDIFEVDTTDANGEANCSYTPISTGNITIVAISMNLSDTVQIQVT